MSRLVKEHSNCIFGMFILKRFLYASSTSLIALSRIIYCILWSTECFSSVSLLTLAPLVDLNILSLLKTGIWWRWFWILALGTTFFNWFGSLITKSLSGIGECIWPACSREILWSLWISSSEKLEWWNELLLTTLVLDIFPYCFN